MISVSLKEMELVEIYKHLDYGDLLGLSCVSRNFYRSWNILRRKVGTWITVMGFDPKLKTANQYEYTYRLQFYKGLRGMLAAKVSGDIDKWVPIFDRDVFTRLRLDTVGSDHWRIKRVTKLIVTAPVDQQLELVKIFNPNANEAIVNAAIDERNLDLYWYLRKEMKLSLQTVRRLLASKDDAYVYFVGVEPAINRSDRSAVLRYANSPQVLELLDDYIMGLSTQERSFQTANFISHNPTIAMPWMERWEFNSEAYAYVIYSSLIENRHKLTPQREELYNKMITKIKSADAKTSEKYMKAAR